MNKYETNVKPYLNDIREWYTRMTIGEIADQLCVSRRSFYNYIEQHKELAEALESGKKQLVKELKDTLKRKAMGFYYTEKRKTIKEVNGVNNIITEEVERYSPPDTASIHLLLKNLDETWHNDDAITIQQKQAKIDLEKQKAEQDIW